MVGSNLVWLVIVLSGLIFLIGYFFGKRPSKFDCIISLNKSRITVRRHNGNKSSFLLSGLEKAEVLTKSNGPFSEDIFYKLTFSGECYYFPSNGELVSHFVEDFLLQLPDLREDIFIQAMSSTSKNTFLCYEKNA